MRSARRPDDQVEVVHGDTAKITFGMGPMAAVAWPSVGSAMAKAMDKIVAKGQEIPPPI